MQYKWELHETVAEDRLGTETFAHILLTVGLDGMKGNMNTDNCSGR